ncbi:sodium:solute symporter [Candidatus Uabimicrobium sp. HlEnr_7]|uniref:sodium:solute symporter n=1 Tax=Candidatus Uabimicrobium helgolandensis TaxID=3095367 RepID=UPI0035590069
MNYLDWIVVVVYLAGMIALAVHLGKSQKNGGDYYLGGNDVNYFAIAISTMATQCSTNSLLGAPAFVIASGGLLWLQNELAVPLAMIGVMIFLLPFFRKQNIISVYEYLEKRFGVGTRTFMSVVFQILRAFATGVTVYGISIVLQEITGMEFWLAALILGVITIIYDMFGGMKAVIYSDIIQMVVLYGGIAICLYYAVTLTGGWTEVWNLLPADKANALDFSHHGLGDGKDYAFWPMLIGGFFLYVSYYGCDQTQVQRELSSKSIDDTNMSLFINGILRFPLVITYCLVGVAIAAFIIKNPEFLNAIPKNADGAINYNLTVPQFCIMYLPHGVIGLIMIALFSAAMSSLDSTINSLSATTMRDIVERFFVKEPLSEENQLFISRSLTVFWGVVCVIFSFFVGNIGDSIIEAINKIGSLANGSILATFLLAILTRRANGRGTVIGIICGFAFNVYLWLYFPKVSWLWWNLFGCVITFVSGYVFSILLGGEKHNPDEIDDLIFSSNAKSFFNYKKNWPVYYAILVGYFGFMIYMLSVISSLGAK